MIAGGERIKAKRKKIVRNLHGQAIASRRIFRIAGQRANFSIWETATPEELHATLLSLPMHPFMDIEVTPIIEHTTTQAWQAANGAMPPF
jgi:muconolactone D-isomerase